MIKPPHHTQTLSKGSNTMLPETNDLDQVDFDAETLIELCDEFREVHQEFMELKKRYADLEKLLKARGAFMAHGVKVQQVRRKGAIDYTAIPAVARMTEEHLEKFRKDASFALRISVY